MKKVLDDSVAEIKQEIEQFQEFTKLPQTISQENTVLQ
jgi:hypothetical protein